MAKTLHHGPWYVKCNFARRDIALRIPIGHVSKRGLIRGPPLNSTIRLESTPIGRLAISLRPRDPAVFMILTVFAAIPSLGVGRKPPFPTNGKAASGASMAGIRLSRFRCRADSFRKPDGGVPAYAGSRVRAKRDGARPRAP
jgi:hypothetical protein